MYTSTCTLISLLDRLTHCISFQLQAANWDPIRASTGIVCIDEADKISRKSAGGNGTGGRDVGGEGVQQVRLVQTGFSPHPRQVK